MWIVSAAEQVTPEPSAWHSLLQQLFSHKCRGQCASCDNYLCCINKVPHAHKGNLFPHSSRGWKLGIKMDRAISSEASLSLACR